MSYGKAIVAFSDRGFGYAILSAWGSAERYRVKYTDSRLIRILNPNPSAALMVWEGEIMPSTLDFRVDGRWRECSKTELEEALRQWAINPEIVANLEQGAAA